MEFNTSTFRFEKTRKGIINHDYKWQCKECKNWIGDDYDTCPICYHAKKQKTIIANPYKVKTKYVSRICEYCKKEFKVEERLLKHRPCKYCSCGCRATHKALLKKHGR
jgi:hypothetical protein